MVSDPKLKTRKDRSNSTTLVKRTILPRLVKEKNLSTSTPNPSTRGTQKPSTSGTNLPFNPTVPQSNPTVPQTNPTVTNTTDDKKEDLLLEEYDDSISTDNSFSTNISYWEDTHPKWNELAPFQKEFLGSSGFFNPDHSTFIDNLELFPADNYEIITKPSLNKMTLTTQDMVTISSLIKTIPIFDVNSSKYILEDFVENAKTIYDSLNDKQKEFFLINIKSRFSEDAKENIRGIKFDSVASLETTLRNIFIKKDIRSILVAELCTCRQQPDETLTHYQSHILKLYNDISSLYDDEYSQNEATTLKKELETQACNSFKLGIRNTDIRHRVQASDKKKLTELISIANDAGQIERYSVTSQMKPESNQNLLNKILNKLDIKEENEPKRVLFAKESTPTSFDVENLIEKVMKRVDQKIKN